MEHGGEVLIFFTMFAGGFAMIFGIYYLKTRQNLAMIDKGMNPKQPSINQPAPYRNLKWALLLIGAGLGLFTAYMLDTFVLKHGRYTEVLNDTIRHEYHHDDNPAIYFSLIAVGGGLGLLLSYFMEKKWWDQNKTINQEKF
jgi:NADH:ubiquinone oxidoreductase subunit 5 (subunit L)/multisubunit Na+/H+ antiporter MnhA subunit